MKTVKGRIHSVETFGALDGPGIRYVLFLQGCPLSCLYCHNPDSWDPDAGIEKTSAEVMKDILRYRSFITPGGGVTLSGGEPLMQPDFCAELIRLGHENGLHMAVDTSGSVAVPFCRAALETADLLLLDIKAFDNDLCRRISGRGNENTLQTLDLRERLGKPVWIRHVIVPGLTLVPEELVKLADYLVLYRCIERVELLPFHKMGEYKWEALGRDYTLSDTPVPTPEEVEAARQIFRDRGLPIR